MPQELEEKLAKAAERERDLSENNQRLENHISDLESRKRAPLYQKKQEEELRAATEKAQEAEARAKDAELKSKEAKVGPPKFFFKRRSRQHLLCNVNIEVEP